MKRLFIATQVALFLMLSTLASAAWCESSPVPKLEATAKQIVAALAVHKSQLQNDPKITYNIVNQYLVPLVDQQAMAQAVLGRAQWQRASAAERQAFITQFRLLVVRTYAAAFSHFTDERVMFQPIRESLANNALIMVNSEILRSGRPPLPVNYQLERTAQGWRVVDFSVDGISMIESFRAQFAAMLAQQGLSDVIENLKRHNQQKA